MPVQKPGESKQDYGTPRAFIAAVERRFGRLCFDLAASVGNAKAPRFFTEADNALAQPWHELKGNLWLNPPFANIERWAKKCAAEGALGARIFFLTPASIGTDWFHLHVQNAALVEGLRPRLTFEGMSDPYPKDLMLSAFGFGAHGSGTWRWDSASKQQ